MISRAAHIRGCVLYFFLFMAYGSISPFMPLIWRGKGLSEHQVGLIGAVKTFVSFFVTPLLCWLADKYNVQRQMFTATLLLYPLARSFVLMTRSFSAVSAVEITTAVVKSPIGSLMDAFVIHSSGTDGYGTQRLWGAIGFGVATFIGGSVSDAAGGGFGAVMAVFVGMMTISAVVSAGFAVGRGEGDNSDRGGSGGSGGSDGNGGERGGRGGAIVEGKSSTRGSGHSVSVGIGNADDGSTASEDGREYGRLISESDGDVCGTPKAVEDGGEQEVHHDSGEESADGEGGQRVRANAPGAMDKQDGGMMTAVRTMLGSIESASFFGAVCLSGMGAGVIDTFLFIRLEELGGSHVLCGTARLVMCLAEVPFFYLSGPLIRKIGVRWVIAMTELAYLVRFLYYSVLQTPWWILPVELLHGLTFAAMWAATTDYAYQISPAGLRSTIQGLVSGVHWGFGFGFGAIGGGVMYAGLGADRCFLVSSALPTLALLSLCLPTACRLWQGRGMIRQYPRRSAVEYELVGKEGRYTNSKSSSHSYEGLVDGENITMTTPTVTPNFTPSTSSTSAGHIADDV